MRNLRNILVWLLLVPAFFGGVHIGWRMKPAQYAKPSELLGFQPVSEDSEPFLVRAAQAELCRRGYPLVIDGDCGKQTGLAQSAELVLIERGGKREDKLNETFYARGE